MATSSLVTTASAQALYPLNYADSSMLIGASQACLEAYNANVSCTSAIGYLYGDLWPNFNQTVLDSLCTEDCFQSLVDHRSNVSAQCASNVTFYDIGAGSTWPVTYRVDQAIYGYNITCVKRSDGQYCNSWFQTGVESTTNPECDECYLVTVYMQAASPFDPDPAEMQSIYSSMSSSCTYTGPAAPVGSISTYPGYATATATFSITPANSKPIPWKDPFAPSNMSVTIIPLADDTRTDCWDYLWWNSSLNSPPSCWSVAISFDITGEQLVLWNPSLKANATSTSDGITNTTTGALISAYDYPCTIEPSVSYCVALTSPTSAAKTSNAPPSPRASGEAAGCTQWFPAVLDCASHLSLLRIDLATLYSLNPSVKPDCSGYVLGTYYCYSKSVDGSVASSNIS